MMQDAGCKMQDTGCRFQDARDTEQTPSKNEEKNKSEPEMFSGFVAVTTWVL